jgi:hypothetical protein
MFDLWTLCGTFGYSDFASKLCATDLEFPCPGIGRVAMTKYIHHLLRMYLYEEGIVQILAEGTFHPGTLRTLSFDWLKTSSHSATDLASSAFQAVSDICPRNFKTASERAIERRLQGWSSVLCTSIHPELQLIIHMDATVLASRKDRRVFGCNGATCWSCWSWIKSYNYVKEVHWTSGKGNGEEIVSSWSLPGISEVDKRLVEKLDTSVSTCWIGQICCCRFFIPATAGCRFRTGL